MKKLGVGLLSLGLCFSCMTNNQQSLTMKPDKIIASNHEKNQLVHLEEKKSTKKNSNTLDKDIKKILDTLETDYNKVNWGVEYSIFEDSPGVVASVSLYSDDYSNYLVLGITNLYNENIDISANIGAYNKKGDIKGDSFVYEPVIGTGSTVIYTIYCGEEIPDGRIKWEDCELYSANKEKAYIPWEMDYNVKPSNNSLNVEYEMMATDKKSLPECTVQFMFLDKEGNILAIQNDYINKKVKSGKTYKGSLSTYVGKDNINKVKQLAVFANPIQS